MIAMDDDFKRELVLLFATEAAGLLDRIAQGLADLEGASAPGHVLAQLRRELHSLKGARSASGSRPSAS